MTPWLGSQVALVLVAFSHELVHQVVVFLALLHQLLFKRPYLLSLLDHCSPVQRFFPVLVVFS
ncbi:hypothetical protein CGU40_33595 [Pseudomonas aeruginosa]|nr:hypothetical protein A7R77_32875 [Pseudomonas aeruginosa]OZO38920.1 hypothetical protein CGU40_33595 [Pseudomonas aeruginosa]